MLKCEVGEKNGCHLEMEGTILDHVNDINNIIRGVHHALKKEDTIKATLFHALLIENINNPATWGPVEERGKE